MSASGLTRPLHVRRSVAQAVEAWVDRQYPAPEPEAVLDSYPPAESILRSLPQRQQAIDREAGRLRLPYYEFSSFHASFWRSVGRLFTWLGILLGLLLGALVDRLARRDTPERRAVRLRHELERGGGTFVKFGQQAAMRIDLLPWAYCVELSKMLDRMKPFPVEEALEAVNRTLGRPWQEVFEVFDPVPVGSASIACIYQATLKGGAKVVVKVRRPGIGELFMADLKVIDWISELAEFLTILRPGFTRNLRSELRDTLVEELDFRREGRFQDTFRRNATTSGKDFFTAPRVYFEYSGEDVLVQEFVTGLWLWEVIAAVEQRDPGGRALLQRLNIDPGLVGRRILWTSFWSMEENVFFHADPHPANILVRRDSMLTFVDFGSCGSFNSHQRRGLQQTILSMGRQDIEGMTQALFNLMEPLPPVDLPEMVKQANEENLRVLQTFSTPAEYTQYWERTSARQWVVLLRLARKFNVPLTLHTLRMIRATLLYDSIVLRLDNLINRYDIYGDFLRDRAQLVKRKWRTNLREVAGDGIFLAVDELGQAFNDLMVRAQTSLNNPVLNFSFTVNKWAYAFSVIMRMIGRVLGVTLVAMGLAYAANTIAGHPVQFTNAFLIVTNNRLYQLLLLAIGLFGARNIFFRMRDRDTGNG
jgi:ubiquinone biosynthesis protein